jgi:hypothetical protein
MTKHACALAALLAAAPAAAEPASFFIQTGAYATEALAEIHCAPLARLGFPLAVTPDETPGGRRLWFCRSEERYARAPAEEILAAVREQDGHDDAILVRDERAVPPTLREAIASFLDGEPGAIPASLRAEFEAFMRAQEAGPPAEPPAPAKTPEPPKTDQVIAFDFRV